LATEVVVLTLGHGSGCADGCGGGCDGTCEPPADPTGGVRVPVLACRDALRAGGAAVTLTEANSDTDIDTVLARLPAPPWDTTPPAPPTGDAGTTADAESTGDGRATADAEPIVDGGAGSAVALAPDGASGIAVRLVVAVTSDGELRAVLRRLVRRYAPPASRRPDSLPVGRTVPDLPPVGVLPLDPAGARDSPADLVERLGLPRSPTEVAAAVLAGGTRPLDLLRTDAGSVTLHGALLGGTDEENRPVPWHATVNVDDTVLTDGSDPLLACVVANAAGYAELDGLPMVRQADPADGEVDVAVAVLGTAGHRWLGNRRTRIEVRRARGRAVAVTPRDDVPFVDDGVDGTLGRKRTWWIEPAAWSVYTPVT
jgi:hypothetical protein